MRLPRPSRRDDRPRPDGAEPFLRGADRARSTATVPITPGGGMKKFVALTTVLAAMLLLHAAPARAQEGGCRIICAPVFVAQPGLVVQNSINAPELDNQGTTPASETDFLLRFTTVIPTQIPRTALVALVQW